MKFDVYSVQRSIGSMLTTVKFRVTEQVGELIRIKDDCEVTIEGVYELSDEALPGVVETIYKETMGLQ